MERGKDHFQIELALRRGLEPVARVPELIIRFRNPSVVFCNAKIASIFESTNTARQRSSAIKGLPLVVKHIKPIEVGGGWLANEFDPNECLIPEAQDEVRTADAPVPREADS
jgi:hypothetical protein